MASVNSNAATVRRDLLNLARALDPTRKTGNGETFGDRLAMTATEAVRSRTVDRQESPDGQPLPQLAESTKKKKTRFGLDPRILVATGEMLHADQIEGDVTVTRNEVVMEAGTDEATKDKVHYAHAGSTHRPERPFFELGADGEEAVDALIREVLDDAVRGGTA